MQEKVVPWKEWCGIRDIFAHQYSNLDCQSAWDTIRQNFILSRKSRYLQAVSVFAYE